MRRVYLIDTNVISEIRKGARADPGVADFFARAKISDEPTFIASITIGELRRGVAMVRHRGDAAQAARLESWLTTILDGYAQEILAFDADAAQIWGRLRVPDPSHALDKQIAAIALLFNLTVVTRNAADFAGTGVKLKNPFSPPPRP